MSGFAALSAMQAVRLMNQGALVLDLRGKEAFDAGHIGDARNVPAAELEISSRNVEEMAREEPSSPIATAGSAARAPRAR